MASYLQAISSHWKQKGLSSENLVSIYFGGGTPSLLAPDEIAQILSLITPPELEITLEANPESLSLEKIKGFKDAGINRLSIGVQSFDDTLLKTLKRHHTAADAIHCIENGAKHFDNISIDLMYDLPSQTLKQWRQTLTQATTLPITHLSLYNLVLEEGTPFYRRKITQPGEEIATEMYTLARSILPQNDFKQYEISAFAKPNCHSRHNIGYWQGRPFIGLGPAAFSYWEGRRFRNIANLTRYCEDPTQVDFEEQLEPMQAKRELLAVGLRMLDGVDLDTFQPLETETLDTIDTLVKKGLLQRGDNRLKLTDQGVFFYDAVAAELI